MDESNFLVIWGRPCVICDRIKPRKLNSHGRPESIDHYLDRKTCDDDCHYILASIAGSASALGRTMTLEHRLKIGEGNRGLVRSPELIAQQTAKRRGTRMTTVTRQRMSAASLGKSKSASHARNISIGKIGTKASTTTCKNISKAVQQQWDNPITRAKLLARRRKTRGYGEVVTPDGRFESASDAARYHGISPSGASYRARKKICGWRYV